MNKAAQTLGRLDDANKNALALVHYLRQCGFTILTHQPKKHTMKRQLTPEQTAKRDERRAQFKRLWKTVADMPELERIQYIGRRAFTSCDDHAYSLGNSMMIALQIPGATILGGFRQWLKHGRAVRKGEHGAMIWVPIGSKSTNGETGETSTVMDEKHFTSGTVFDISQTQEVEAGASAIVPEMEIPEIPKRLTPQPESRETVLASMTQNFFSNMAGSLAATGNAT